MRFLEDDKALCRPFVDFKAQTFSAQELLFYSDATKNPKLGFGGWYKNQWVVGKWEDSFIQDCGPSIEFLELFAVAVNIFTWGKYLANKRVIILCEKE